MLSFTTTRSIPTGAGLEVVEDVVENDERGINAVAALAAATARTAEAKNFMFYFLFFFFFKVCSTLYIVDLAR